MHSLRNPASVCANLKTASIAFSSSPGDMIPTVVSSDISVFDWTPFHGREHWEYHDSGAECNGLSAKHGGGNSWRGDSLPGTDPMWQGSMRKAPPVGRRASMISPECGKLDDRLQGSTLVQSRITS